MPQWRSKISRAVIKTQHSQTNKYFLKDHIKLWLSKTPKTFSQTMAKINVSRDEYLELIFHPNCRPSCLLVKSQLGFGPCIPACQDKFESRFCRLSLALFFSFCVFSTCDKDDFYVFIQVLIKMLDRADDRVLWHGASDTVPSRQKAISQHSNGPACSVS